MAKRILQINNFNRPGGAETVFNITRQNIKNHEIYSGYCSESSDSPEMQINFYSWENQNKFWGAINYIFSYKNYIKLKNYLNLHEIDIIHIHGFFSAISPSILKSIKYFKQRKKIKVIQTHHDYHLVCPNSSLYNYKKNRICNICVGKKFKLNIFWNHCDRRGFFHSFIKGIRSLLSNHVYNHADVIDIHIAPSLFLKSKLIEDGIDKNKIHVIRNPISISRNKVSIPKKNLICFWGRLSKEKNLEFLLNSFIQWKKLFPSNFKLMIVGDGEEAAKLKSISVNSDFSNDIEFTGFLSMDLLKDRIKEAKYFCLTSSCYENAPMSVLEAISMNIIPLVPDIGGMKETIELLSIGDTYQNGNTEAWIKKINQFENNYNIEFQRLVDVSLAIGSDFSIDEYIKNIELLYDSL